MTTYLTHAMLFLHMLEELKDRLELPQQIFVREYPMENCPIPSVGGIDVGTLGNMVAINTGSCSYNATHKPCCILVELVDGTFR